MSLLPPKCRDTLSEQHFKDKQDVLENMLLLMSSEKDA
jgi:hypothetical protein